MGAHVHWTVIVHVKPQRGNQEKRANQELRLVVR